jgi:hypothetical protein
MFVLHDWRSERPILYPPWARTGGYVYGQRLRAEWARMDFDPALPIHLQSEEYHRRARERAAAARPPRTEWEHPGLTAEEA